MNDIVWMLSFEFDTRLTDSFAPIFYFNYEQFLLVYIVKQKQTKKFADLKKNIVDFQNLMPIEFCWRLIFEILITHKPSLGSFEVPYKIQPLYQTFMRHKQTNWQTSKIYIMYIFVFLFHSFLVWMLHYVKWKYIKNSFKSLYFRKPSIEPKSADFNKNGGRQRRKGNGSSDT